MPQVHTQAFVLLLHSGYIERQLGSEPFVELLNAMLGGAALGAPSEPTTAGVVRRMVAAHAERWRAAAHAQAARGGAIGAVDGKHSGEDEQATLGRFLMGPSRLTTALE